MLYYILSVLGGYCPLRMQTQYKVWQSRVINVYSMLDRMEGICRKGSQLRLFVINLVRINYSHLSWGPQQVSNPMVRLEEKLTIYDRRGQGRDGDR